MSKKCLAQLHSELSVLIRGSAHRELECREFLPHVVEDLCRERPNNIVQIGAEEPSRFGPSDFVVAADITHGGMSERVAYVWELKAPQLYLYELDDNSRRFRPTKDLVKAETQLIHYVSEFEESPGFKMEFRLRHESKIIPAGIIIGSEQRLARVPKQRPEDLTLDQEVRAKYSHYLRNQLLYEKAGVRVKTWTWVLELLEATSRSALLRGEA